MVFRDRRHAGRLLTAQLLPLSSERPVVIALPRGAEFGVGAIGDAEVLALLGVAAAEQPSAPGHTPSARLTASGS